MRRQEQDSFDLVADLFPQLPRTRRLRGFEETALWHAADQLRPVFAAMRQRGARHRPRARGGCPPAGAGLSDGALPSRSGGARGPDVARSGAPAGPRRHLRAVPGRAARAAGAARATARRPARGEIGQHHRLRARSGGRARCLPRPPRPLATAGAGDARDRRGRQRLEGWGRSGRRASPPELSFRARLRRRAGAGPVAGAQPRRPRDPRRGGGFSRRGLSGRARLDRPYLRGVRRRSGGGDPGRPGRAPRSARPAGDDQGHQTLPGADRSGPAGRLPAWLQLRLPAARRRGHRAVRRSPRQGRPGAVGGGCRFRLSGPAAPGSR